MPKFRLFYSADGAAATMFPAVAVAVTYYLSVFTEAKILSTVSL